MAYRPEGTGKPYKGLSFIDWDGLNEEEYSKLDKIINQTSISAGVQFPFKAEDEKPAVPVLSSQLGKVEETLIYQPTIPPPIVGFPIQVHHWTHSNSSMAPPPGTHYPIPLQGGYVFTNPNLASGGESTVAFVPHLSGGQAIYAIPGVPTHHIPPHYQAEPVDLSIPVVRSTGHAEGQPQTDSGSMLPSSSTHLVAMSELGPSEVTTTLAISHMVPPASHPGIPNVHATQVVYISQPSIVSQQSAGPEMVSAAEHNVHVEPQSSGATVLSKVKRSPSIEFIGPLVFNSPPVDHYKTVKSNDKKVCSHDALVNTEVVLEMESVHIIGGGASSSSKNEQGGHSNSIDVTEAQISSLVTNANTIPDAASENSQMTADSLLFPRDTIVTKDTSSEKLAKETSFAPVKMWSSLFGSKKSNSAVNSAPASVGPVEASKPVVPNAKITEEVEIASVRYWQEQEKAESAKQQTFVPTQKVIPVGVQNDPLAPKIMELLLSLPIIHTPIVIQPRGLVNGSNTCFMNATLQVLMGCPPFVHMFRAFKNLPTRPGSISSTPIFDSLVQFVNSFQNGQRIRNQGSRNKKGTYADINMGQPFTPTPLLSVAQNILGLHIGVQHDAEEFLSQILIICHEELENVMKLNHADGLNNNEKEQVKNGYPQNTAEEVDEDDDMTWQKVGPKNHHVETNVNDCGQTPLSSIFAGLSRSSLIRESGKTSDTVDSFFTLKLDIQAENIHSVKDALLRLNTIETVHDADGGKVQGQRRTFFDVLPPVLILHLKLFQYSNGNGQKIQKKIDFDVDLVVPKETLSRVGKAKLASSKSRSYKLFGVVNHHGMKMNDGHYTSDVYLPAASGWLRFDDSEVMAIHESQVLQYSERRMPYLLFYRRMDLS